MSPLPWHEHIAGQNREEKSDFDIRYSCLTITLHFQFAVHIIGFYELRWDRVKRHINSRHVFGGY
jgi:hypothetical protein